MSTPVEQLSFIPNGTPQKQSLSAFASQQYLNVKHFGAFGDSDASGGGHDDTAAIQSCFDAAFGPYSAPTHASVRPIYFPAGIYKVSSWSEPITGIVPEVFTATGNLTVSHSSGGINGCFITRGDGGNFFTQYDISNKAWLTIQNATNTVNNTPTFVAGDYATTYGWQIATNNRGTLGNSVLEIRDDLYAASPSGGVVITGGNTITRSDPGGDWTATGRGEAAFNLNYVAGQTIRITNATSAGNVGSFVLTSVTATQLVVSGTPLTNTGAPDTQFRVCRTMTNHTNDNTMRLGTGRMRITVASTHGLVNQGMVYCRGIQGTTFANGAYSAGLVTSTGLTLVGAEGQPQFAPANWVPGTGSVAAGAIQAHALVSAYIYGAGKTASVLKCVTPGAPAISTNALYFSLIANMSFEAAAGGIAFDFNWTQRDGDQTSSQSDLWTNCAFMGGDYGLPVCFGAMGSECLLTNCDFIGCTVAGVYLGNANALDINFIGGSMVGCTYRGLDSGPGVAPSIFGMKFSNGANNSDIFIQGVPESYVVNNCFSDSDVFIRAPNSSAIAVKSCTHLGPPTGEFIHGNGAYLINDCKATTKLAGESVNYFAVYNCDFPPGYTDALGNPAYVETFPKIFKTVTTTPYVFIGSDAGKKLEFNSSSAQIAQLVTSGSLRLGPGNIIELQRVGTGSLTITAGGGTTIHATPGASLSARYSYATLRCDSATYAGGSVVTTEWTLSGDLA